MNATDRIKYAEQRIKELKLLIHHWKKSEKQNRVSNSKDKEKSKLNFTRTAKALESTEGGAPE